MLFCTFTLDNSSFLTTVKKKMFCVSLFSVKNVSDLKIQTAFPSEKVAQDV